MSADAPQPFYDSGNEPSKKSGSCGFAQTPRSDRKLRCNRRYQNHILVGA
jgi:hypothetical protein